MLNLTPFIAAAFVGVASPASAHDDSSAAPAAAAASRDEGPSERPAPPDVAANGGARLGVGIDAALQIPVGDLADLPGIGDRKSVE